MSFPILLPPLPSWLPYADQRMKRTKNSTRKKLIGPPTIVAFALHVVTSLSPGGFLAHRPCAVHYVKMNSYTSKYNAFLSVS